MEKQKLQIGDLIEFETLKEYYDSNLLSNLMAPMFPEHSRNTLWVLKNK